MRRACRSNGMKRRLVIIASLTLLLLCLASVVTWVRSYWVVDQLRIMPRRGLHYLGTSSAGSIILSRSVLSGRTSDAFSDDLDCGPGWSVQSRRAFAPAVSPFTPEGSPRAVQSAGFDYLARDVSRPGFG